MGIAIAASLVSCGGSTPQPGRQPAPSAEPSQATAADVGGTWVLHQALTASEVDTPTVETALDTPGVKGYSLRVPWQLVDGTSQVLDAAAKVARAHSVQLSIRFMAGRWTPARVFDEGSPYYTVNGRKVPTPFTAAGTPNAVFESAYEAELKFLTAWCKQNGVHLLHLPWYGQNYAELNNGKEVRSAPGYTYAAWLTGHERLFDIASRFAGDGLSIEFPLSGYGPLVQASKDLAQYIASRSTAIGDAVYVQANGLSTRGDWGAASPPLEQEMEQAVWPQAINRGEQMIGVGDYEWDAVFARVRANHASYIEIYDSSFVPGLPHHDALLRSIATFAGS